MKDMIDRIKYFMEDHKITLPKILAVGGAAAAVFILMGVYFLSKSDFDRAVTPMTVGVVLAIADFYGWYGLAFHHLNKKNVQPEPQMEFYAAPAVPKMRFNFPDDIVREEFERIADTLGLTVKIARQKYEIFAFGDDNSTKYGYSAVFTDDKASEIFCVYIDPESIAIEYSISSDGEVLEQYSFLIFDDFMRLNRIKLKDEYANSQFEDLNTFIWEGDANPMSDREIFAVIEKIMSAVNGTDYFDHIESQPIDLYRKHYQAKKFAFRLNKPYSLPEEIITENFRFIINGGI